MKAPLNLSENNSFPACLSRGVIVYTHQNGGHWSDDLLFFPFFRMLNMTHVGFSQP